jgi:hypothetical protein
VVAVKRPKVKQGRRTYGSQIPDQGRAESRIMGLLIFGAAAGVAYGFWVLTQFVENWAGFQAGIRRLVE